MPRLVKKKFECGEFPRVWFKNISVSNFETLQVKRGNDFKNGFNIRLFINRISFVQALRPVFEAFFVFQFRWVYFLIHFLEKIISFVLNALYISDFSKLESLKEEKAIFSWVHFFFANRLYNSFILFNKICIKKNDSFENERTIYTYKIVWFARNS